MEKYFEVVIKAILDCLEECASTMTIASGKRLIHVFYVTLGFLVFSIVLKVLGYQSFISRIEAIVACVIIGLICCIDYMNKVSILKVKEVLSTKINKEM